MCLILDYKSIFTNFSRVIDLPANNSDIDDAEYFTNGYTFAPNDVELVNDLLNSIALDETCEYKI